MLRNSELDAQSDDAVDSEFSGTIINEHELLADSTGEVKEKILNKFEEYKTELTNLINAGVSPAQYEKYNGYLAAIDLATKAIDEVWKAGRRDE